MLFSQLQVLIGGGIVIKGLIVRIETLNVLCYLVPIDDFISFYLDFTRFL